MPLFFSLLCKRAFPRFDVSDESVGLLWQDGRAASSILVGAMFIFCNLYSTPGPAVRLLYAKRPGIGLSPSHRRYRDGGAGCALSGAWYCGRLAPWELSFNLFLIDLVLSWTMMTVKMGKNFTFSCRFMKVCDFETERELLKMPMFAEWKKEIKKRKVLTASW